MNENRLRELLDGIAKTSVAVIGDFCVDAYWTIDPELSEVSVETGLATRPVRSQAYSLGGAGNIVANLVALGVAEVRVVGVVGDDLFGREMLRMLNALGVDTSGMVVQAEEWSTPVYAKPHVDKREQARIDFGVYNAAAAESEERVLKAATDAAGRVQSVIVNQQLPRSVQSDRVIDGINRLATKHPKKHFVVDSRDRCDRFRGMIFRVNAHEAARLCGREQPLEQSVGRDDAADFARRISEGSGRPVFISQGERGAVVHWDGRTESVRGIQILKETDPVGAGDTSVSALAASLAAGATPLEAAELANFASAVTVQKLRITGTATPEEVYDIGVSPDYVYRPELAGDPRAARFFDGTEIEVVAQDRPRGAIRHALFDHDGTVSTLRQGWEPIMEESFLRAILGTEYDVADESVYQHVARCTRDYIQRSTGIETIRQTQALVEMVQDFGHVPAEEILDAFGYKALYLERLMLTVSRRLDKLERGELDVNDFTMKGVLPFLKELRRRGVTLYLASGTDHDDVAREAAALGYADLFDGGIFGASGRPDRDVKKEVIERLIAERGLAGPELVCFGDGPVELREGKRHGGVAVGVASDEVRRYGLNLAKRERLVSAGADLIVPDFSQHTALIQCLFG
jgi:rfaE bifunctional protein kinase chain/domain